MKEHILKFHLEAYSVIVIAMIIYGIIIRDQLTVTQTAVLIMMGIGMLHEWEEKRKPGGFFETLPGPWGWETENLDFRKPAQWVVYAWLVITIIPFFVTSVPGLALAPVYLGIFEAFIHTMGRKLTGLAKKYFPGIVTAWFMAICSVYCLYIIIPSGECHGWDYVIGAIFIIVVFFGLQVCVQKSAGSSIPKMMQIMKTHYK